MSDQHASSTATATTHTLHPTQHTIQLEQTVADREPPPPPVPASDPCLAVQDGSPNPTNDLFQLPALEALKLLSANVELLVRMTGDIPPTPPPKTPTDPQMSDIRAEKERIVRSHSEKSLLRLRQQAEKDAEMLKRQARNGDNDARKRISGTQINRAQVGISQLQAYSASMTAKLMAQQNEHMTASASTNFSSSSDAIDGVRLRKSPTQSSPPTQRKPYVIIGADSQPLNLQHGAITRKFYSKNEPPISIHQYLLRLHQFCPMSTAVYLATSLYIHRLAVEEQAIPVTRRNAHRLVLAGLRVAMKALEDLSYPHAKVAKVGGVSEVELARLEISFCFLAGFELVVGEEVLKQHWGALKDGKAQRMLNGIEVPTLKLNRKRRGDSSDDK